MFLTYNGVNLALTSIDRVNRDTILSDDGTTVVCVETTLSVSGVYHPPVGGVPHLGGTSVTGKRRNRSRSPNLPPKPRNTVRGMDPGGNTGGVSTSVAPVGHGSIAPSTAKGGFNDLMGIIDGIGAGIGAGNMPSQSPAQATNSLSASITGSPGVPPAPITSGSNPLLPSSCNLPSPGSEGWAGPINTDRELELRLRTPRKKLIVWAFDSQSGSPLIWIESPRRFAPSDARTGPIILNCSVKASPNGNSFFVSIDIRTWLSPCEDGSDRPILSHRWQMVHTEDENHYLTRVVRGQAIFDLGNMLEAKQNPDWFRRQLFHPIPLGFRRRLGPITVTPDGSTLEYEYSDTDQTITFDAWDTGASSIQIIETVRYHNPWRGIS